MPSAARCQAWNRRTLSSSGKASNSARPLPLAFLTARHLATAPEWLLKYLRWRSPLTNQQTSKNTLPPWFSFRIATTPRSWQYVGTSVKPFCPQWETMGQNGFCHYLPLYWGILKKSRNYWPLKVLPKQVKRGFDSPRLHHFILTNSHFCFRVGTKLAPISKQARPPLQGARVGLPEGSQAGGKCLHNLFLVFVVNAH